MCKLVPFDNDTCSACYDSTNQYKFSEKLFCILGMSGKTNKEYGLFQEYDSTLRSKWGGVHKAANTSTNEVTHTMLYGKGRLCESGSFLY